jgi:autotransporter-associated beta strand protein
MLAAAAVMGSVAMPRGASAATHIYTPNNGTGDLWSGGTDWDVTPVSGVATTLTFVGNNATVLADGLLNTNTDDLAALFQLNLLNLQGTGANAGGSTININTAATGLELISNGATTPIVNLNALAGTSGLTYNINAPLTLTNNTLFTGAGTANFNFLGGVSGAAAILTRTGAATLTLGGATTLGQLVIGNNNNANSKIVIASGGSISVGSGSGTLSVGTSSTATAGSGILDASLASSFTANVATVNIGGTGNNNVTAMGTLNLGASNNITATASFVVGNSSGAQNPATPVVTTAAGSTTNINTPNMTIAASKSNALFTLGSGATVNFRGAAGGATRTTINVGNYTTGGGSSSNFASLMGFANANMSAGTFNAMLTNLNIGTQNTGSSSSNILGQLTLGASGSNHLDVSGTGNVVVIGRNLQTTASGRGIGTLTINNLDSSSSVTTTAGSTAILIGQGADSDSRGVGTLNLNGGTLTVNTTGSAIGGNANGTSTLNLNGGTLKAGAGSANWISGLTQVNVRGGGATFDTNGNNVTISQPLKHSNTGTLGAVSITNGGTLYSANPTVVVTDPANPGAYAVATPTIAGGAVTGITLAGEQNYTQAPTVTITGGGAGAAGATATVSFTPDAATDGGITKAGAGTLTLSAVNTYTGNTNVNAGRLDLTGSLTSNVIIANGADLGGEGSTTGSLTFNGASNLFMDPTTAAAFTAGSINASSASVLVAPGTTPLGTDIVVLSAAGGISGAIGTNFLYNNRGTLRLSNDLTQLLLDNTGAATLTWRGNHGTNPTFWDLGTTNNWVNGVNPDVFLTGDNAVFDDTAAGYTVAIQGTSVSPASVTFNNSFNAYTITGGAINGVATLTKNGSNIVVLANNNTYSGATTINAGTIQLGDGVNATGSFGPAAVVNNAAIVTNYGANNATLANNVSGTGTLTKNGSGTLTVTGAITSSGATTINAGTMQLSGTASLANGAVVNNSAIEAIGINSVGGDISGTGTVATSGSGNLTLLGNNSYSGATTVAAATTLQIGNGGTSGTLGSGATSNSGTLIINRSDNVTVGGAITGTGTVSKRGAGTATLSGSNTAGSLSVGLNNAGGTLVVPSGASLGVGSAGTGTLQIGVSNTATQAVGTLDASAASSLSVDVATISVGVTGNNNVTAQGTLNLPTNSTLIAATSFIVGDSAGTRNGDNGSPTMQLTTAAGGISTVRTPIFTIGGSKSSATFTLGAGNTWDLTGTGITPRTAMAVGNYLTGGGAGNYIQNADLSAGILKANLSSLVIADQNNNSGSTTSSMTSTMTIGTDPANHLDVSGPAIGPAPANAGVVVVARQAVNTATNLETGVLTIGNLDATSAITATDNGTAILVGGTQVPGFADGTLNLNGGTLTITTTGAAIAGGALSTVNFNGMLLKAGASSTNWIHDIANANIGGGGAKFNSNGFDVTIPQVFGGSGDLTKSGAGSVTLNGANTYTGPTSATGGTLVLGLSMTNSSSVSASNDAVIALPSDTTFQKVIKTGAVSVSGTAKIDLSDNKMITTDSAGTATGATYNGIQGLVQSGRNGGTWNGSGIVTSQPNALSGGPFVTTIGVATATQTGDTTFAGIAVSNETLVMYTYAGDANLDGRINADDYALIDLYSTVPGASGYYKGDFNYNGAINADDYALIDFNVLAQGSVIPSDAASPLGVTALSGVTAVPEPATFGLVTLAAVGALGRRRRRA